jgi:hypothetical protein
MDKNFLDTLMGPFPMETPPLRDGFFAVALKDAPQFEMWFWNGSTWSDSDDGLGESLLSDLASGWYGQFPPGTRTLDDGL